MEDTHQIHYIHNPVRYEHESMKEYNDRRKASKQIVEIHHTRTKLSSRQAVADMQAKMLKYAGR